jgi:hypothetical protein
MGRMAVLALLLLATLGCSAADLQSAPAKRHLTAATDLEGGPIDPLAESQGRVVVLTFVRSDCPVSNRYAPTLRRLSDEFTPRGASFYLVYPTASTTAADIHEHLQEYDYGMAAIHDAAHTLVRRTGVEVTPEAAVFDREGKLVYRGRIDDRYVDFSKARAEPTTHDLRDAIEAALSDQTVPTPVTKAVGCFIVDVK